jgi:Family of unknown function (DUF6444)
LIGWKVVDDPRSRFQGSGFRFTDVVGDFGDTIGIWPSERSLTVGLLVALPPEIQGLVRSIIDHYERRIAKLETRLGKSSQHSSPSPSSQRPYAKPPKSKNKRGGQPGHTRRQRPLIPTEQCDEVQPLIPTRCRRYGTKLAGRPGRRELGERVWRIAPSFWSAESA